MSEDRLSSLLLAWQEEQGKGRDVSAAELCRDCPELAEELRRRIRALHEMKGWMGMEVSPSGPGSSSAEAGEGPATASPSSDAGKTLDAPPRPVFDAIGAPQAIPGYELLGELGRGGMGVVYKVRQMNLGRVVALKMILVGGHAATPDLARFRTEAAAIARLQHPNIVQIYEFGEYGGLPYFSLEYCNGGSLAQKLNGTPLPPGEAAVLIGTLARAIHAAHQKGIIHRDLKPPNVLLADDGTPKITDFGLAKNLEESGQTASGAVMGTPSYMAPEQVRGSSEAKDRPRIGPPTDVHALGAILYECLTGRPPYKAVTALDTMMQVLSDEPVPPTQLQPKTPRDLETICLKCLQKEPTRRYASAGELAEDLRRFASGAPIIARPVGMTERALRWARRRPALVAAWGLLVLALGVWGWREAHTNRRQASVAATEGSPEGEDTTEHDKPSVLVQQQLIVRGCRVLVSEFTDVTSECEGKLLFLGTDVRPGEVVPNYKLIEYEVNILAVPVTSWVGVDAGDRISVPMEPGRMYRRLRPTDDLAPGTTKIINQRLRFRSVDVGDRITAGQLLGVVNPDLVLSDMAIKLSKVEGTGAEQKAAEARLEEAKRRLVALDSRRSKEGRGSVSDEDYGIAKATVERCAQEQISKRVAVQQAQKELSAALVTLNTHMIRSSIDGVITEVYKRRGEGVKKLDRVLQVQSPDRVRIEGKVEIRDSEHLRRRLLEARRLEEEAGQLRVAATLEGRPEPEGARSRTEAARKILEVQVNEIPKGKKALTARLSSVEALRDPSKKKVTVRVELDNPGWIMPGQTVTLVFPPD